MSITAEHPVIRWEKDLVEFKILVDTYMYTGEVHTCSMDISHAIIRCEFCNKPYATLEEKEAFLEEIDRRCPVSDNLMNLTPVTVQLSE